MPIEWRLDDVQNMASVSAATAGSTTPGVAVGPPTVHCGPTRGHGRRHSSHARTCPAVSGPADRISSPPREPWRQSYQPQLASTHGHTILQEKRAAEFYDEVGQRSLERLFRGFTEDSMVQVTLGAGQSGRGCRRARDIAAPAHMGTLIAAKPRIQAMIQDAVLAGLLLQRPLETRLAAAIATDTSANLDALDDEDRATAKLYVQKAAQAAEEAWQQPSGRLQGLSVTNPTVSDLEHPTPLLRMKIQ